MKQKLWRTFRQVKIVFKCFKLLIIYKLKCKESESDQYLEIKDYNLQLKPTGSLQLLTVEFNLMAGFDKFMFEFK